MDLDRFDKLAMALGDVNNRRGAVRVALGGLLAGLAGVVAGDAAEAGKKTGGKSKGKDGGDEPGARGGDGDRAGDEKTAAGSRRKSPKDKAKKGKRRAKGNDARVAEGQPCQPHDTSCCAPKDASCAASGTVCCQNTFCTGSGAKLCCPNEWLVCGNGGNARCVDKKNDDNNCGECGKACPAGTKCEGGFCRCNQATCKNGCCKQVNNSNDYSCEPGTTDDACGRGGNSCARCKPYNGQTCAATGDDRGTCISCAKDGETPRAGLPCCSGCEAGGKCAPASQCSGHKVEICHLTASATNPYNEIEIDESALPTHLAEGDLYPVPAGGCPGCVAAGNKANKDDQCCTGCQGADGRCVACPPVDVCPGDCNDGKPCKQPAADSPFECRCGANKTCGSCVKVGNKPGTGEACCTGCADGSGKCATCNECQGKPVGTSCANGAGVCCGVACQVGKECCDNQQCGGGRPVCSPSGTCVECTSGGQCTAGGPCQNGICEGQKCRYEPKGDGSTCAGGVCCGGTCNQGKQCCSDAQCTNPGKPNCKDGICVACRLAADCTDATACQTAVCNADGTCSYPAKTCPSAGTCQTGGGCDPKTGCLGVANKPAGDACSDGVCNGNGACVQCNVAADCGTPGVCQKYTCPNNTCVAVADDGNDAGCAGLCCDGSCKQGAECCSNGYQACDETGETCRDHACVCGDGYQTCTDGACLPNCGPGTTFDPVVCACTPDCTPRTCNERGFTCGGVDNCGTPLDCGTCPNNLTCSDPNGGVCGCGGVDVCGIGDTRTCCGADEACVEGACTPNGACPGTCTGDNPTCGATAGCVCVGGTCQQCVENDRAGTDANCCSGCSVNGICRPANRCTTPPPPPIDYCPGTCSGTSQCSPVASTPAGLGCRCEGNTCATCVGNGVSGSFTSCCSGCAVNGVCRPAGECAAPVFCPGACEGDAQCAPVGVPDGVGCRCKDGACATCAAFAAACATAADCCPDPNGGQVTCDEGVCSIAVSPVCAARGASCQDVPCCKGRDTCRKGVCVQAVVEAPSCHHVGGRPRAGERCCDRLHLERGRCVINRWDHCDQGNRGKKSFCERGTRCVGGRLSPHGQEVCVPSKKRRGRGSERMAPAAVPGVTPEVTLA